MFLWSTQLLSYKMKPHTYQLSWINSHLQTEKKINIYIHQVQFNIKLHFSNVQD